MVSETDTCFLFSLVSLESKTEIAQYNEIGWGEVLDVICRLLCPLPQGENWQQGLLNFSILEGINHFAIKILDQIF